MLENASAHDYIAPVEKRHVCVEVDVIFIASCLIFK